jgi:hypothetical protein
MPSSSDVAVDVVLKAKMPANVQGDADSFVTPAQAGVQVVGFPGFRPAPE